jgi:hypothetical protein
LFNSYGLDAVRKAFNLKFEMMKRWGDKGGIILSEKKAKELRKEVKIWDNKMIKEKKKNQDNERTDEKESGDEKLRGEKE